MSAALESSTTNVVNFSLIRFNRRQNNQKKIITSGPAAKDCVRGNCQSAPGTPLFIPILLFSARHIMSQRVQHYSQTREKTSLLNSPLSNNRSGVGRQSVAPLRFTTASPPTLQLRSSRAKSLLSVGFAAKKRHGGFRHRSL